MAKKKLNTKKGSTKKTTKKKTTTKVKTLSGYKQNIIRSMYYDLWIGGKKVDLDRKECIEQIVIRETVDGSDSCTIQIADPDFKYINDNIYQENKKVKVTAGWYGFTYRFTFNGYISAIDIDFGSDGIPTLILTCMDNTYRMNKTKRTKTFKNKTSAQVVKSIVKKYGYKCVIQSGYKFTKQDTISQSDQTDIELIVGLANSETYPFTACLVGDTFYYVKMGKLSTKATNSLTYRDYPHDIISFTPQINTETIEQTSGSTNTAKKSGNTATSKTSQSSTTDSSSSDKNKKKSDSKTYSKTYNPKNKKWTTNK